MSLLGRLRRRLRRRLRGDSEAVALCRTLAPEDWQHLHEADAVGRGVILVSAGDIERIVMFAELWLDISLVATADDELTRAALGNHQRVLVANESADVASALASRLAAETGCEVVPVAVAQVGERVSLRVGSPTRLDEQERPSQLVTRIAERLASIG